MCDFFVGWKVCSTCSRHGFSCDNRRQRKLRPTRRVVCTSGRCAHDFDRDRTWPNLIWPSLFGRIWPILFLVGARKGGGRRVGPERWVGQNFALFFSRRKFHSFFSLWEVFSWNFGGVFEGQDPQTCAFGVLWLSCEALAARSGGATTVSHDSPRARMISSGREKKKARNFGRSGGAGSGGEAQKS